MTLHDRIMPEHGPCMLGLQDRTEAVPERSRRISHTRRDCKRHVMFIPRRRRAVVFWEIRTHLGPILHDKVLTVKDQRG